MNRISTQVIILMLILGIFVMNPEIMLVVILILEKNQVDSLLNMSGYLKLGKDIMRNQPNQRLSECQKWMQSGRDIVERDHKRSLFFCSTDFLIDEYE